MGWHYGCIAIGLLWANYAQGATVLAHYEGGGDPLAYSSSTLTWRAENANSTNVVASAAVNDDRSVRSLLDPGVDQGGVANNLYYNVRPTSAQILSLQQMGWDLTMSMKIPGLDEVLGPSWNRDGNTSLGFYYVEPGMTGYRTSFLLTAGRDAAGNTLVVLTGGSHMLTLTPEFHAYTLSYREGVVTLYVDGEARLTTTGTTAANTSTVNMMYWGDNNNATAATSYGQRLAYYEYVQLTQVPEPQNGSLIVLGVTLALITRKRR